MDAVRHVVVDRCSFSMMFMPSSSARTYSSSR